MLDYYTTLEAMINDAERKCLDETVSPCEISGEIGYKYRDIMFYYDGIRTMARALRDEIKSKTNG